MRRVLYLFLPNWPIDRLRRLDRTRASPGTTTAGASPADDPADEPADDPADETAFATVSETGNRRLIAAVNRAAAAAGITPGMPLADALSFLPGLITMPAEPAADSAALTRLAEWCQRYSPWTAPDVRPDGDGDGVKIEITGAAHLWGGEARLVEDLAARLRRRQIAHRLAIAGTIGAAWALARFAAPEAMPALPSPEDERKALAPLPVEALRLDPAVAAGLRRVGLRRVGDLYPMPRDALARRFGEAVACRLDQALGEAPEPLSPLGETPVRRVRLSFAEPIADPADLALATARLTQDLVARLAREGTGARHLDLAFHRVDGRVEHIRLGTARPTRDPRHLAALLTAKLESVDPGFGVEDMILAVFAVEPLPPEQISLPRPRQNSLSPTGGEGRGEGADSRTLAGFTLTLPSPRVEPAGLRLLRDGPLPLPHCGRGALCVHEPQSDNVAPLLDRLGARLGLDALSRIEARQSHIPERAAVCIPIGDSPHPGPPPVAGAAAKPPRPVRLLQPPEPIEAAWLLPDDPPFQFTWRRRAHRVNAADGPERIAEEWWTAGAALVADAIRDYYRVEDAEGRRFWLFRAGLPDGGAPPRWFLHGLFA